MEQETFREPRRTDDSLEIWFQRIYNELNEIAAQIESKEGFLFFKNHTLSKDDLLNHPSFKKSQSILENLQAIVARWDDCSKIPDERLKYFQEQSLKVSRDMSALRQRIITRTPTGWEEFKSAFEKLFLIINSHLPQLPQFVLDRIGYALSERQKRLRDEYLRNKSTIDARYDEI